MSWFWFNQKKTKKGQSWSNNSRTKIHHKRQTFILEEIITPSLIIALADTDSSVDSDMEEMCPPDEEIINIEDITILQKIIEKVNGGIDEIVVSLPPDVLMDPNELKQLVDTLPPPVILPIDPPDTQLIADNNNPINDFPSVSQPKNNNYANLILQVSPETLSNLNQGLSNLEEIISNNSSGNLIDALSSDQAEIELEKIINIFDNNPDLLTLLAKPDELVELGISQENITIINKFLLDQHFAQSVMGLPVSLGEALSNPDSNILDNFLLNAEDAYLLLPANAKQTIVGVIDFAQNSHVQKVNEIFSSINPLTQPKNYIVKNNDWASELVKYVNNLKYRGETRGIVNLSFDLSQLDEIGETTRYELTSQEISALQYARDHNVLVIAASGNTGGAMSALGRASLQFDNLITVGAVDQFQGKTDYSAYGNGLTIMAPGGSWQDDPSAFVGTSKATSYVTATASLIWSANPALSWEQVKNLLIETARDLNTPGWDAETGVGLVDVQEAISRAITMAPTNPPDNVEVVAPEFSGINRVITTTRPVSESTEVAITNLTNIQYDLWSQWQTLIDLGNPELDLEDLKTTVANKISQALSQYDDVSTERAIAQVELQQIQEELNLAISHYQIEQERLNNLQVQKQELEYKLTGLSEQKSALEEETKDLLDSIQTKINQAEENLNKAKNKLLNPFANANDNLELDSTSIYNALEDEQARAETFQKEAIINANEATRYFNLANSINPVRWQIVGQNSRICGRTQNIWGWGVDSNLAKIQQQYNWQGGIASINAKGLNDLSTNVSQNTNIFKDYAGFIETQTSNITDLAGNIEDVDTIINFLKEQINYQNELTTQYLDLSLASEKLRIQNQANADWHNSLTNRWEIVGYQKKGCKGSEPVWGWRHYPEHIAPARQAQQQANLASTKSKNYSDLAQQSQSQANILTEQLRKLEERAKDWPVLKQGIEYEIAGHKLRLQAEQDLLSMYTPIQEQKLETIDLYIEQTQTNLNTLVQEKLPEQEQLTNATEQRWIDTQTATVAKQNAYDEAQNNLQDVLAFSGFLLPYRERFVAISKQIDDLETEKLNIQFAIIELNKVLLNSPSETAIKQLNDWSNYLEKLDQHLNWANIQKDQLALAIADSPERLEIANLIKDLINPDAPVFLKDKIANLQALEGNKGNFLAGFDDLTDRLGKATTEVTSTHTNLEGLYQEYIDLGLEKSNLVNVLIPAKEGAISTKEQEILNIKEEIATTSNILVIEHDNLVILENEKQTLSDKITDQENLISFIKTESDDLQNQINIKQLAIVDNQNTINNYQSQINVASNQVSTLEQQRHNHQVAANYWNGQIYSWGVVGHTGGKRSQPIYGWIYNPGAEANRNAHQNVANSYTVQRDQAIIESNQLETNWQPEINTANQEIETLTQEKNSLVQEKQIVDANLSNEQQNLQSLQNDLHTVIEEINTKSTEISQIEANLEQLNTTLSTLIQEGDILANELADMKSQIPVLEQELLNKYREIDLNNRYLEIMQGEQNRLQSRLNLLNQVSIIDQQYSENWQDWQSTRQTQQDLLDDLLINRNNSQPNRDLLTDLQTQLNNAHIKLTDAKNQQKIITDTKQNIQFTELQIINQNLLLRSLIEKDADLAKLQSEYYTTAIKYRQQIYTWNGKDWVYNQQVATAYRAYLQQASIIADQRNKLSLEQTQAKNTITTLENKLDEQKTILDNASTELDQLGNIDLIQRQVDSLTSQINTVKAELQPFEEAEKQIIESLTKAVEDNQKSLDELTQTSILEDTALKQLISFGILASESDVDFLATEVIPQVNTFLEKLQNRSTILSTEISQTEVLKNNYLESINQTVDPILKDTQLNLLSSSQDNLDKLQDLKQETEQSISELTELLTKANDALLPLRQKQELEIRQKIETNTNRLYALDSLLNTENIATQAIENNTVLDYVKLRDQVHQDLVTGVKNWTQILVESYAQTKNLGNSHQDLSASVDQLISDITDNLADPQGEYNRSKLFLDEGIKTLGVLENRADQLDLSVNSVEDAIAQIKLRIEQDAQLWAEIALIANRYGLESEELQIYQSFVNQKLNVINSESAEKFKQVTVLKNQAKSLRQQAEVARKEYLNLQNQIAIQQKQLNTNTSSVFHQIFLKNIQILQQKAQVALNQYQNFNNQATNKDKEADSLKKLIDDQTNSMIKDIRADFVQEHPNNGTAIELLQETIVFGNSPTENITKLLQATQANVLLKADALEGLNPNQALLDKAKSAKATHEAQGYALLNQANWYQQQAIAHWNLSRKAGPYWYEQRTVRGKSGKSRTETITHVDYHWIVWQQYSSIFPKLRQQGADHLAEAAKWQKEVERIEPLKNQWSDANNAANDAAPPITEGRNLFAQLETAHASIPADEIQLASLQELLPIIQQQLEEAQREADAQNAKVNAQWESYDVNSEEYLTVIQDILNKRGELNKDAITMQGQIADTEKWVERQSVDLATELENTKTVLDKLKNQRDSLIRQSSQVDPTQANEIQTKLAQLEPTISQLNNKATILTAEQTSLTQKRTLLTAQNEVILAEQRLLDAYIQDPDADNSNLQQQLLDTRTALAEAQRLAEQAEKASQALTAPVQELKDDLIAQNSEHLTKARIASQVLKDLVIQTEANKNYALEMVKKQTEVNNLEFQILQRLQIATEAGYQEAKHLLDVARHNDMATATEIYYRDYSDLANDKGGGCSGGGAGNANDRLLADTYYQQMLNYRVLQQQAQTQANTFGQAKVTAQAQMNTLKIQQNQISIVLQDLQEQLNTSSTNREKLEQDYAIAQIELEGITRIRDQTEQTFSQLISLEQLNLQQAQLEQEFAQYRQAVIDQALQDRYERDYLEIQRKRQETTARLEQLRQLQAEDQFRETLNVARSSVGLDTLESNINSGEVAVQLAGLLAGLQQLQGTNPEFPPDLNALLDEVNGDINAALQGKEASSIQDNLLNAMSGLIEQIDIYKNEINKIDLEDQLDSQLLQTAQVDLQGASQDLLKELARSSELQAERDVIDPLYMEVLNKIALAEQAVDISNDLAEQGKGMLDQIINQRIAERKARKKAFWNKILSIVSSVIGILGTILSFTPLAPLGIALTAASAGINAIQSILNGDWIGGIFSIVMAGVNAVTAGMGNALSQGARLAIQGLQNVASGALNGVRSIMSGDNIMGFLQILSGVAGAVTSGLSNVIGQAPSMMEKMVMQVFNSLKSVPTMIYSGVQSIQNGDWFSAIGSLFNSVITLGTNFAGVFNDTASKVFEYLGKIGNTGLAIGGGIINGTIESWLSGINSIIGMWGPDIANLIDRLNGEPIDPVSVGDGNDQTTSC
jgi:hypothetical protein